MPKIKIGIIGAGNIAVEHLKVLKNIKDFSVLGIVSRTQKKAKKLGKKFGIKKIFSSIDEWNEGEKVKVQCETLDNLFSNTPISGIKMDIENFEYFALKGGEQLLKNYHPVIYLELWENDNRTQCFTFLSELGYSPFVNDNNNLVVYSPLKHKKQNFIFKVSSN